VRLRLIKNDQLATWSPVGPGLSGSVGALVRFDEGEVPAIAAGGDFALAGGAPTQSVARWVGCRDASVIPGDLDGDGAVDAADLGWLGREFGRAVGLLSHRPMEWRASPLPHHCLASAELQQRIMTTGDREKLAALVNGNREALLSDWRRQVREIPSARGLDAPTLNDHIPGLLDELVIALREQAEPTIPEALSGRSATAHGLQRVENEFDIEEVVSEYNVLRACVHDLADANGVTLQGKAFHTLNRVLDGAIGLALETYATQRAMEVRQRREEYLAFVAHDLRTPLCAISMAARVIETEQSKVPLNDVSARMLKVVRRSVQQLEALVGKVLEENTNLETELGIKLQLRDFDLWPLVEALVHDLHPVAGTSSTRMINTVPEDLVVHADASLVRRVFQNLIANAIKYTPRGEITISARDDGLAGVVCRVRDNGAGIAPEFLPKVFDKGESEPGADGGSGLGLAIVKTFVEAHGGTVHVESTEGQGSTFSFVLPQRARSVAVAHT